jgi:hypothetical protein
MLVTALALCAGCGEDSGSGDLGDDAGTDADGDTDGDTETDTGSDTDTLDPDGDEDGDGIPNDVEGDGDKDDDGVPNYEDEDSDGDGVPDADEAGDDPEHPVDSDSDGSPDYLDLDSDNDGLPDSEEATLGTDPTDQDSDDDGVMDIVEVAYGSDPNDGADFPPPEVFFVILPFEAPEHELRDLTFGTDITYADVLITVDLSVSMGEEHTELAAGINSVIVDGITAAMPESWFGLVEFGTFSDQPYEVTQPMTADAAAVQTAVEAIGQCTGSDETHAETLYQAATGEGFAGEYCNQWETDCVDWITVDIPAASCPSETVGGACFRDEAMPIFIMASDEDFIDAGGLDWSTGDPHSRDDAIDAMNAIGAKFIGIDSGGGALTADYNAVSAGTGSYDSAFQPFNFEIASDGTGLNDGVVDAVIELTENVPLDVTTLSESVDNPHGVDTTEFIEAVTPDSADPPEQIDSMDTTTFYGVHPGTSVTFEVDFYNDVFEPETAEATMFEATIYVIGESTQLDSREVYVIVPGLDAEVQIPE